MSKIKIIPEIRLVQAPELEENCCNGCYFLDKCEECDSEVGFIWVEEKLATDINVASKKLAEKTVSDKVTTKGERL